MSKTVIRYDRGTLRRPETTAQGFLRADGIFGRAGIYEYRNDDGSIRRELRPVEEVQHPAALASFADASLTIDHPADGEVTAENVRRHEVGAVSGAGRADGEDVAGAVVIKDARAIKLVKAGKQELSPGYKIELDESPGTHPKYGRYDAIQRNIRVNHLAIVDRARGGSSVRLRMDAADQVRRDDDGKLTSVVAGHQHLVCTTNWDGQPRTSGETSCAMSEGADKGHDHPWTMSADGTVAIGMSDGHSHSILGDHALAITPPGPRADAQFDRSGMRRESHRMDDAEQIRSLKEQLATAVAKLGSITAEVATNATRADSAQATADTLRTENDELRAQIAAAATAVETATIARERTRADAAEDALRLREDSFGAAVEARVALERKAAVVLPELNMRGLTERSIVSTVVKRLDAKQDIGAGVTDAYLRGRFDSLIDLHERNARSLQRVSDVVIEEQTKRADSVEEKRRELRNQGTQPLPNSREAAAARGRA